MTVGCWLLSMLLQVAPPKGHSWNDAIDAAKKDAESRGVPLLVYVGSDDVVSKSMHEAMEKPEIVSRLKHFACLFLSNKNDPTKFRAAYDPWVAPKGQSTPPKAPILSFGNPKGEVQAGYRVEGKKVTVEELAAHLNKVLVALAPAEAARAKIQSLEAASLPDVLQALRSSLDVLESNLSADGLAAYREEQAWSEQIVKTLEQKVKGNKEATADLKSLKKLVTGLDKFTGKNPNPLKEAIEKARSSLQALAAKLHP